MVDFVHIPTFCDELVHRVAASKQELVQQRRELLAKLEAINLK